jgi:hypothetical protein
MRRRTVVGLLVAAFLGVALIMAPGASSAPPPSIPIPGGGTVSGPIPQPAPPIDYPAGYTCAFPLHAVFPVNQVVGYTYTDSTGRVVAEYFTGALILRLTRTDTGKSVTANLSGDGIETFGTDGTDVLYGFGPFGSGQHPGDTPGPFYAVLHGISAVQVDATGHKTILFSTRVENLCTELA